MVEEVQIDISDYIHIGFCYDCPYLSDVCSDECELYGFLTEEQNVRTPSDYCEKFCKNRCDTECRINHTDRFKLIHARDIILDRKWNNEVSLRHCGVNVHEV